MVDTKKQLIDKLKNDILLWQGFKPPKAGDGDILGLADIAAAFPNGVFPRGAIHEFISVAPEHSAASDGFIAGLLSVLMQDGAACVWISTARKLYPTSLSAFNVEPHRVVFMDVPRERDALWIMEEALRCEGLSAVVAELSGLSLTESRRLQLAVEQSGLTGFILRKDASKMANTIATARWKVTPLPSVIEDRLPGIGYPRWYVELLKVRNGNPGSWILTWSGDQFVVEKPQSQGSLHNDQYRKIG